MFVTVSSRFAVGWVVSSAELMTSIGEAELVTVRSVRRVPVMTIWSLSTVAVAGAGPGVGPGAWAAAGFAITIEAMVATDARRERLIRCALLLVMKSPQKTLCLPTPMRQTAA